MPCGYFLSELVVDAGAEAAGAGVAAGAGAAAFEPESELGAELLLSPEAFGLALP